MSEDAERAARLAAAGRTLLEVRQPIASESREIDRRMSNLLRAATTITETLVDYYRRQAVLRSRRSESAGSPAQAF